MTARDEVPASLKKPPRISVEERLFSLVLALMATEQGLRKIDILSSVQGYRQRYEQEGDTATLDRLFERDKDDIRELGIPIETIDVAGTGINHDLRYRIPRGSYVLPSDIHFSSQELAILKLAGTVWREGSLSRDSRRAVMKLQSLGADTNEPLLGYAPRLRTREPAFDTLSAALDRSRIVTFHYMKPGDTQPRERRVSPLAIVYFHGFWHLYGFDNDADEVRTFLLARIVGAVTVTKHLAPSAPPGMSEEALVGLEKLWHSQCARIRVVPESSAAISMATRVGKPVSGIVDVNYTDLSLLADELASFGPEVMVLSPPELIDAVKERLRRMAALHSESPHNDSPHSDASDQESNSSAREAARATL